MEYQSEISTPEGMVQLIATNFLQHGYYWYVTGNVPEGKDRLRVDRKLVSKYGIDVSTWERSRRKRAGLANAKYLRHESWFIILVTQGHHQIKQPEESGGEKGQLRDCRRVPIRFHGYSISYRRSGVTPKGDADPKWHAHVRIDRPTYTRLKAHFLTIACHRDTCVLLYELNELQYARYAPIRRQLLNLLRIINKARASQGLEAIPTSKLILRRTPVTAYQTQPPTDPD